MSTAAIALIGVVVGSLLTAVSNFVVQRSMDKRRWKRENRLRNHEDRLNAYTMLAREALRLRISSNLQSQEVISSLDTIWSARCQIQLLAPPDVFGAAEELGHAAIVVLDRKASTQREDTLGADGPDDKQLNDDLHARYSDFMEAVRGELGILPLRTMRLSGASTPG